MNRFGFTTAVFVCLLAATSSGRAVPVSSAEDTAAPPRWSAETLDTFARIPIQEGGRVKPLDTYARFKLLAMNGKRSCKNLEGERLTSLEWLLDTLFYPERSRLYDVFIVQTSEVIDAMGLDHADKKKRDRYSYEDLAPGRVKLFELATQYEPIEPKDRSPVQAQIVFLAYQMAEFEAIHGFLNFARTSYPVERSQGLSAILDPKTARFSDLVRNGPVLVKEYHDLQGHQEGSEPGVPETERLKTLESLADAMGRRAQEARGLKLLPPPGARDQLTEWLSPEDLLHQLSAPPEIQVAMMGSLEDMVVSRDDRDRFQQHAASFQEQGRQLAEARGEYSKVGLEVMFYKGQFFYYGLVFYVLSFLTVAVSWLKPNRWLTRSVWGALGVGTVLLITGIVLRCVIRGRPPVSTLYETILFITAVGVLACMGMEWINRRRIGLALATLFGAGGLFLANKYEIKEGMDTMPSLVAVLDTNFWLATHVTTITMGYSAGLVAAGLAHIHILGRLFGFRRGQSDFYRGITRMVYGTVCFSLLCSVVGTILGGIWANESWGRFWGWDPKENGALLICLWQLSMIHARMGGFVRDHGFCVAAVVGGAVVAFSWWGVNLLGVGLHSYGFTSGILRSLMIFYGIEGLVVLLGTISWWRDKTVRMEART